MISKRNKILFIIFILDILISPNVVLGDQKPPQTIYPLKDAHVTSMSPDHNWAEYEYLLVAEDPNPTNIVISFIYFELPANYSRYDNVYLHFHVELANDDSSFIMDFCNVTQTWHEFSITWNNKPATGNYLFTKQVFHDKTYDVNVKGYLTFNFFSICIKASYPQNQLGLIVSSENSAGPWDYLPAIILRDEENNYLFYIVIGLAVIVGLSGEIGYFYYTKKRKKRQFQE